MAKILFIIFLLILSNPLHSQLKIVPKFKHLKIIGSWEFRSMEVLTYADKLMTNKIQRDEKNNETITFHKTGLISYTSLENNEKSGGEGEWLIKDDRLRIITDNDTINGNYSLQDGILSITMKVNETKTHFAHQIKVTYTNKSLK